MVKATYTEAIEEEAVMTEREGPVYQEGFLQVRV